MRYTFKYTEELQKFLLMLDCDDYNRGDILDNEEGSFLVLRKSDIDNTYMVEQYCENYNEIAYNHWKFLIKYNIV